MKVVILAGGKGTRLSEETINKPKPMVEIGGMPILWHIMKLYSAHEINDFIICCGYKGYIIKEYFSNYFLHMSDVTFDMQNNNMIVHNKRAESWKITLVDTGEETMTGGRLLRVKKYLNNDKSFCFTYGDGVGDINITKLIKFHNSHGKKATLTSAIPPGRFGLLQVENGLVKSFKEKSKGESTKINGGYFVLNSSIFDFIEGDKTVWEQGPLTELSKNNELMAFEHNGFWQPMDTLRDRIFLEELWTSKTPPWKIWND
jgi:glucose-1-phosphate cytidylyltransferase